MGENTHQTIHEVRVRKKTIDALILEEVRTTRARRYLDIFKNGSTRKNWFRAGGEEYYPVSLIEVELPRVSGNNVKVKSYAVNQKFPVMVPNTNLIYKLWPNLESKLKHEILQNAY